MCTKFYKCTIMTNIVTEIDIKMYLFKKNKSKLKEKKDNCQNFKIQLQRGRKKPTNINMSIKICNCQLSLNYRDLISNHLGYNNSLAFFNEYNFISVSKSSSIVL